MAFFQKHKVFGNHEILFQVAGYLYPESQVACLQVSRDFHTTIAPSIYASVTLGPIPARRPSLETLRRYSSLVTTLSFDAFISAEYLEAGYTNLKSLSLINDEDSYHFQQGTDHEIMEALLKVMRENPRLSQWTFEKPYPVLSAKVWEAIEGAAHRSPEGVDVESNSSQDNNVNPATTADVPFLTSVVISPQGGSDIDRVSFRIDKERVHAGQVRSGIKLLQVTPASISQGALPWATCAFNKAEALMIIPAKLEPFCGFDVFPDRVLPQPEAPIARYVGLQNVYQCTSMDQLEFLSHFNHARGIYWNISKRPLVAKWRRVPPTIKDWKQWIQPDTTWPHLRSLTLCCYRLAVRRNPVIQEPDDQPVFTDDCVAYALNCIPRDQLEQFWWYGVQMGPLGIEALAGQFSTLREVKLELTSSLEQSAYIQRIMESCPHLQVLRAGHLSVGHMRRGRPWVCLGLKSLSLRFDMQEDRVEEESYSLPAPVERERVDYAESQRYVFSRLSELVLLEELTSIPLQAAGPDFVKTWNLDFQLQYGLGALSSLRRLKRLVVSFTKQQMSAGDIDWMVQRWTMLQSIEGSLTGNKEEHAVLESILNADHILFFRQ